MFGWMKPVEFNSDGTIVKAKKKGGGNKSPKKKTNERSSKEEKIVKIFLAYVADMKYEHADAEKFLTNREKKAVITLLGRIIKKLEK